MRNYKTIQVEDKEITDIVCDRCGKVVTPDDMTEWQEFTNIEFIGGYGSVFGDENHVTCDLCQYCLDELIGKFCYINQLPSVKADGLQFQEKENSENERGLR